MCILIFMFFFFSSRRRHTSFDCDWSSDVCSSELAVRLSRVRQLVRKGDVRARVVEGLLGDLHRVVSAVQLGITVASLALGALGESTLAGMIRSVAPATTGARDALIVHAAALAIAFVLLSALHVVIGELVPKTVSLARAERVALMIA